MAPFTYTMRLINGHADELSLRMDGLQSPSKCQRQTQLRGHIEKACSRVPGEKVLRDLSPLSIWCSRVNRGYCYSNGLKSIDLIRLVSISIYLHILKIPARPTINASKGQTTIVTIQATISYHLQPHSETG